MGSTKQERRCCETAVEHGEQTEAARGRISAQARRHNEMRRQVLSAHPQARELAGPDWRSALAIPVLLAVHWGLAWAVSGSNLMVVFVVAFCFGQLVMHSAGSLVHETAHKLIFRDRPRKLAFDLGLELVLGSFGRQLNYQHDHISSHHPYVGDYERDYEHENICGFVAKQFVIKARPRLQRAITVAMLILHLLPFGFLVTDWALPKIYRNLTGVEGDTKRHIGASKPSVFDKRLFMAVSLALNVFLLAAFGVLGWLYHNWALSIFLGKFGITNLGQSLSEHDGDDEVNPTRSCYGAINAILFNTGYHNEHHTFPNVAWSRLPALKKMAPDVFHHEAEYSYAGYWWRHVRHDFSPSRRNPLQGQDNSDRCPRRRADWNVLHLEDGGTG